MTDHPNNTPTRGLNSAGLMKAVAIALMHVGKLDKDQRGDVIMAALDALKTSLIDDLTHGIGAGELSDEEVVARIVDLGVGMEQIRRERISRFANLCELLKPDVNIVIDFSEKPERKEQLN